MYWIALSTDPFELEYSQSELARLRVARDQVVEDDHHRALQMIHSVHWCFVTEVFDALRCEHSTDRVSLVREHAVDVLGVRRIPVQLEHLRETLQLRLVQHALLARRLQHRLQHPWLGEFSRHFN